MGEPATTEEQMVLGLLADAGGDFLLGEVVSGKLGLRPAEVYRLMDRLRDRGYRIDAVGRHGYRLVSIPDRLSPLELEPFLTTHDFGRGLHYFEEVSSTNEVALDLARVGAFHGETVIAEHQTAGRGRRGREWLSPAGRNLTLSVILRPTVDPTRAPELTFVTAVAVVQTLRDAFNLPVDIKWPNDVVVSGRKIAGILTELETREGGVDAVVVGIGLNVNMERTQFPAALQARATSLRIEVGEAVHRPLIAAALLARFESQYDEWVEYGFEPVRSLWRLFSATLGREVRVIPVEGRQGFDGVAEDIDETGALLVRGSDGRTRKVVAGDVEHLEQLEPGP